jgi:hypothetical protein
VVVESLSVVVESLSVVVESLSVVVVSLSVVVVEDELSLEVDAPSSLLAQEIMVKLKRNMEKMMSICLTRVPISGLGEPKIYQNLGDFSRIVGFYFEGV